MCEACKKDSMTHSFDPVSVKVSGAKTIHAFYTSSKTIKDCGNAESICQHIESMLGTQPWMWIIDCKYVSSKHMAHVKTWVTVLRRLSDKYGLTLQAIYLINAGPIIKTIIGAFTPFITKEFASNIVKLNGSPLELLEGFKGTGWTMPECEPIIRRIQADYV